MRNSIRNQARVLGCVGALALGACGGPSLGDPESPTSNQMQASKSVDSTGNDLVAIKAGGPEKAFTLQATLFAVGPLATKTRVNTGIGFPLGGDAPAGDSLSPQADPPACVTGNAATGWTYNMCKNEDSTINGTVKVTGDTIAIDLKITSTKMNSFELTLKGTVTVTATTIDGTLQADMTPQAAGGLGAFHTKVTYAKVTFGGGCVSSGDVLIEYSGTGISQAAEFEYTACNTFKVRNAK